MALMKSYIGVVLDKVFDSEGIILFSMPVLEKPQKTIRSILDKDTILYTSQ